MSIPYFPEWFSDPNTDKVAVLEVEVYEDIITGSFPRRFFSTEKLSDLYFHQNYTEEIEQRLISDISITREAPDFSGTQGSLGVSIFQLRNEDRKLDPLHYPNNTSSGGEVTENRTLIEGRPFRLFVGEKDWVFDPDNSTNSEFQEILSGKIEEVKTPNQGVIELIAMEFLEQMDQEIQNRVFDPQLDTSIDDQLRDQFVPLCFGDVKNVPPVLIEPENSVGIRYKVHDGPIQAIENVYIGGDKTGIDLVGDLSEGRNWVEIQDLNPSWNGDANIGRTYNSVATTNNTLLVGDRSYDSASSNLGKVWVLDWDGTDWAETGETIQPGDTATSNQYFGTRIVPINDYRFLISSVSDSDQGNDNTTLNGGKVYNYLRTGALLTDRMNNSVEWVSGTDYTTLSDVSIQKFSLKANITLTNTDEGVIAEAGNDNSNFAKGFMLYAHGGNFYLKYYNGFGSPQYTEISTAIPKAVSNTYDLEASIDFEVGEIQLYLDGVLEASDDTLDTTGGGSIILGGKAGIDEVHDNAISNNGGWTTDGAGSFSGTITEVLVYKEQVLLNFSANSWIVHQELDREDFSSPPDRQFLAFGIELNYDSSINKLGVGGGTPEDANIGNQGGIFLYDFDTNTELFTVDTIVENDLSSQTTASRFGSLGFDFIDSDNIIAGTVTKFVGASPEYGLYHYRKISGTWQVLQDLITDFLDNTVFSTIHGNARSVKEKDGFLAFSIQGDAQYDLSNKGFDIVVFKNINDRWEFTEVVNLPDSITGDLRGAPKVEIASKYLIFNVSSDIGTSDKLYWYDIVTGGYVAFANAFFDKGSNIAVLDYDINSNGYITADSTNSRIVLTTVEPDSATSTTPGGPDNDGYITDLKNGEFYLGSNPGPFPVTCDIKGSLKLSSEFESATDRYTIDSSPPSLSDTTSLTSDTVYHLDFSGTDYAESIEYTPEEDNPTVEKALEDVNKLLSYHYIHYDDRQEILFLNTKISESFVNWQEETIDTDFLVSVFGSITIYSATLNRPAILTISDIIREIVTVYYTLEKEDIDHDSFDALAKSLEFGGIGGIYLKNSKSILDILDELLLGMNYFYSINFDQKFYLGTIDLSDPAVPNTPDELSDIFINDYIDDLTIERAIEPSNLVQLNYQKNWKAFPELQNIYSDAAFNAGDAPITGNIWENMPERLAFLEREWRTLKKADNTIRDKFPSAKELKDIKVPINSVIEAQQILNRLFYVVSDRRYKLIFKTPKNKLIINNLGSEVVLETPRYNLDVKKGKLFRLSYNIFDSFMDIEVII